MEAHGKGKSPASKVVLLGDSRVGKTSIIARQIQGFHPAAVSSTIGCHCSELQISVDQRLFNLQVWDTAGQEMYRALVPVYLRGAQAALLVYDVSDRESFISLGHWYDTLIDVVPPSTAIYVVGNKIDLESHVIDDAQAQQFAVAHNAQLYKVSALSGQGLDDLFEAVARKLGKGIRLEGNLLDLGDEQSPEGGCC
jgi:small GTP-binding protein